MATADTILDSIVLAFSKSAMRDVVGTDALRTALVGLSKNMLSPDRLQLQPLWDLLEEQPGFVKNDAAPPILLIKTWQPKLGVIVDLPSVFGEVSADECARYASTIKIDPDELDKVLHPPPAPAPPPTEAERARRATAERLKRATEPPRARPKTASLQPVKVVVSEGPRRFPWAIIALVVVLAIGIAVRLATRDTNHVVELTASAVSPDIPLANVRKNEAVVVGTLSDAKWLDKPDDVRRKQLEDALSRVRAFDATSINIFDSNNQLVASASLRGKLIIAFPKSKK